ncbi:MAG: hypothetical protein HPY64_12705 [Anaerolineae bacterium]|nr:hypothetical protein [Anaerolineae bacterium]
MALSDETGYRFGPAPAQPPRRVVSLAPALTESIRDLALVDRLVGVTDDCLHLDPALSRLSRLGSASTPHIERIRALQPDLVLLDQDLTPPEHIESLEATGLHGWVCHPRTVQQAINLLWEIMDIFEEATMVERVRWIERQMDWTWSAASVRQPVRVLVPVVTTPRLACLPGTYGHDLLRVCGGECISPWQQPLAPSTSANYPPDSADIRLLAEAALQSQPEVILLPGKPWPFTDRHVAELAQLDIPAARSGHIHLIDGTLLAWYGTRVARALVELPPLLLPNPAS